MGVINVLYLECDDYLRAAVINSSLAARGRLFESGYYSRAVSEIR